MGTTTDWDLRYPDPSSDVQLWTHIQNLADDVDDALTIVEGVKICKLRQASVQSIPDATDTVLTFATTSEDSDVLSWHSPSVNNSRITPGLTGWFEVKVTGNWEATTALQYVDVFIRKNGTVVERLGNQQLPSTGQNNVNKAGGHLAQELQVSVLGDYFEMGMRQTSGGSRNTNGGAGNLAPRFSARYLGPL